MSGVDTKRLQQKRPKKTNYLLQKKLLKVVIQKWGGRGGWTSWEAWDDPWCVCATWYFSTTHVGSAFTKTDVVSYVYCKDQQIPQRGSLEGNNNTEVDSFIL